ncbi:4,5-dihydroxyphthalate decarboxylase [Terrihabitans soli]|uniref:4,5-dihydroxyphthalate decarboxylase n=1 Tax=Terrihabitans soli TaxID=708113 RepID=A0A6S6QQC0_9HYPH|nr:ABC transporter substrate-binding protein [Terrihabitans soli]BCJ89955.1 4,5-dihydroxyphthalate decarboxylase [Terrihabitans soli]
MTTMLGKKHSDVQESKKLALTLACTHTDRSSPLLDGRIKVPGVEIVPLPGQTQEIFRRVLTEEAFDIAEMSMGTHIVQSARGADAYVAIPVFLSRAFRHASIFIRTDRGIEKPQDLRGKKIGIEQFQQTIGLWVRGILADSFGVKTADMAWRTGGLEQPGGGERLKIAPPPGVDLQQIPADATLNGMLVSGELDAVIATRIPSSYQQGNPVIGRLFPDYQRAEIAYFKQTRAFPIMHCVVVRRRLVEENPALAADLFQAFVKAKAHALSEMVHTNIPRVTLPWIHEHYSETRALMGDHLWAYGLPASRHELEMMLRYALSDGLIDRKLRPEDLFHPSTHDLKDH